MNSNNSVLPKINNFNTTMSRFDVDVSQCKQAVRRFDEIISLKAAKLDLDRVIDQMRE